MYLLKCVEENKELSFKSIRAPPEGLKLNSNISPEQTSSQTSWLLRHKKEMKRGHVSDTNHASGFGKQGAV